MSRETPKTPKPRRCRTCKTPLGIGAKSSPGPDVVRVGGKLYCDTRCAPTSGKRTRWTGSAWEVVA